MHLACLRGPARRSTRHQNRTLAPRHQRHGLGGPHRFRSMLPPHQLFRSAVARRIVTRRSSPPRLDPGPPHARLRFTSRAMALVTHAVPVPARAARSACSTSSVINDCSAHPAVPPGSVPMGRSNAPLPGRHMRISACPPSLCPLGLRPGRNWRPS